MPIRRRITTTIDEIDDSVDRYSNTTFPTLPAEHLLSDADTGTSIGSPEAIDEEVYDNRATQPAVGRTIADLIIEFKNDHRAMLVALTVISFLIFITKIDSVDSFKYPLLASLVFNFLWFGATVVVAFSKRPKKNK